MPPLASWDQPPATKENDRRRMRTLMISPLRAYLLHPHGHAGLAVGVSDSEKDRLLAGWSIACYQHVDLQGSCNQAGGAASILNGARHAADLDGRLSGDEGEGRERCNLAIYA